jgi:WD40 repeat protein
MLRCCAPLAFLAVLGIFTLDFAVAQPAKSDPPGKTPRVDQHGDPLPDATIARLGTTRFRHGGKELLGFSADGKALLYLGGGGLHIMDVATGKEVKAIKVGETAPRGFRRYGMESAVVLSADTKVVAFATQFGNTSISVVDTDTGKERKRFGAGDIFKNGQQFYSAAIDLTDDGKFLLVSSGRNGDNLPVVWLDTTNGQRVHEIALPKDGRFGQAKFSHDGKQVVTVEFSNDGKTRMRWYDATTAREVRMVELAGQNFGSLTFVLRPDGKTLLATPDAGRGGPGNGPVRLYDFTAGKEMKEVKAFSDAANGSFTMSRDGKQLFIAGRGKVHQWDIDAGKELRQIEAPNLPADDPNFGPIRMGRSGLALSLDGKVLAVSGTHSFSVFDSETGKQQAGGGAGGSAIGVVRFTPDGKGLIVGNGDHIVQQWDVKAAKLERTLDRPEKKDQGPRQRDLEFFSTLLGSASYSGDGKLLAVGLGEGGVGIWDAATGKFLRQFAAEPSNDKDFGPGLSMPSSFAFAPRSNILATGLPNGTIKLWDAATGQALRSWTWHTGGSGRFGRGDAAMLSLTFSPDGKTLAGGAMMNAMDGIPGTMVLLWETSTGKERLRMRSNIEGFGNSDFGLEQIFMLLDQMALTLSFSPDGKTLSVGSFTGLHLVDAHTGKDLGSHSSRMTYGRTATYSPDGKLLFVGRVDGALRVLDAVTGRVMRDFPGHVEPIFSLAVSPDGKTLASGSNDSTVLLWDMAELTKPAPAAKVAVAAKELDGLWEDLGGEDAGKAYQAMNRLAQAPAVALPFLKTNVQPITPVDPKVIESLVNDLNNQRYAVREKATAELEKLGDLAGPELRARLKANPSLEMRQRMEKLVAKLNGPIQSPAVLQLLRGVEVLEWIGTPEALQTLAVLAKGAAGHRVTEDARDAAQRLEQLLKTP